MLGFLALIICSGLHKIFLLILSHGMLFRDAKSPNCNGDSKRMLFTPHSDNVMIQFYALNFAIFSFFFLDHDGLNLIRRLRVERVLKVDWQCPRIRRRVSFVIAVAWLSALQYRFHARTNWWLRL